MSTNEASCISPAAGRSHHRLSLQIGATTGASLSAKVRVAGLAAGQLYDRRRHWSQAQTLLLGCSACKDHSAYQLRMHVAYVRRVRCDACGLHMHRRIGGSSGSGVIGSDCR